MGSAASTKSKRIAPERQASHPSLGGGSRKSLKKYKSSGSSRMGERQRSERLLAGSAQDKAVRGIEAILNELPPSVRGTALFRAAARCDVDLMAEAPTTARKGMVRARDGLLIGCGGVAGHRGGCAAAGGVWGVWMRGVRRVFCA